MRKVPFTVDELLTYTFAPHDGVTTVIANDGTCLLKMTMDGVLMTLPLPDGVNFYKLTDEEWDAFFETHQFDWVDV